MPSEGVDPQAQNGFAKGTAYDQYRAKYSPDAVDLLLEHLNINGQTGAKVLDLAAGTGKFTDALAARDERYEITAVEPLESMRKVLADKKLNAVTVKDGKADSIPLEEASVHAVICAQVGNSLFPSNIDLYLSSVVLPGTQAEQLV